MACRRGDERDGIPPAGPSEPGQEQTPTFFSDNIDPASSAEVRRPGLPAGERWKEGHQECWPCAAASVPWPGASFPVLFQRLLQAGPASTSRDPELLSALLNLTLQPGADQGTEGPEGMLRLLEGVRGAAGTRGLRALLIS